MCVCVQSARSRSRRAQIFACCFVCLCTPQTKVVGFQLRHPPQGGEGGEPGNSIAGDFVALTAEHKHSDMERILAGTTSTPLALLASVSHGAPVPLQLHTRSRALVSFAHIVVHANVHTHTHMHVFVSCIRQFQVGQEHNPDEGEGIRHRRQKWVDTTWTHVQRHPRSRAHNH